MVRAVVHRTWLECTLSIWPAASGQLQFESCGFSEKPLMSRHSKLKNANLILIFVLLNLAAFHLAGLFRIAEHDHNYNIITRKHQMDFDLMFVRLFMFTFRLAAGTDQTEAIRPESLSDSNFSLKFKVEKRKRRL